MKEGSGSRDLVSPAQLHLAAEIGARTSCQPFLGRIDTGQRATACTRRPADCEIYEVRADDTTCSRPAPSSDLHIRRRGGSPGADIATMPFDVFTKLVKHPLNATSRLERFAPRDWASSTPETS